MGAGAIASQASQGYLFLANTGLAAGGAFNPRPTLVNAGCSTAARTKARLFGTLACGWLEQCRVSVHGSLRLRLVFLEEGACWAWNCFQRFTVQCTKRLP